MRNRPRRVSFGRLLAAGATILVLLIRPHGAVKAANNLVHIKQVMAGANGDSRIQFIQMEMEAMGQNLWAAQGGDGTTQSRAMLVFFDVTGRETGKFKFAADPPGAGSLQVLIATQSFADLPGAPAPDVIIPPSLVAVAGKVCFKNNPANPNADVVSECLSYGAFTGSTEGQGTPAPPLPLVNTVSLRRLVNTHTNADFSQVTVPNPTNNAAATFTIAVASQAAQGDTLFTRESFMGNGRSCATCHLATTNFGMFPGGIQARFATVGATFDPLFIGETSGTGFDFNLNTLALDAASEPGDLRGNITGSTGSAHVLARISPTTYLVYGGINPALTGSVTDGTNTGNVLAITAGDLNELETPARMRGPSADPVNFPQGRGLILENIDGFANPPVFRKSPHLVNISKTGPYGFSGDIPNLRVFMNGAITQHYPRRIARAGGLDFRLATNEELAAIEAFMRSFEVPPGPDADKFNLDRFATTEAQRRGRALFFGSAKCSQCHGGQVLATTTVSIQGKPIGVNAAFNTGVVNQAINSSGADNLPPEPTVGTPGSRQFSTPGMFNVKNLGPFFHDASAPTLEKAVEFYTSAQFQNSPAGTAIGGISTSVLNANGISDVVAFLSSLVVRPFTLVGGPVNFGSQAVTGGLTGTQNIVITNTGSAPLTFTDPTCQVTGANAGDFIVTACPISSVDPLAPSESRTIKVAFDPTAAGARAGILEVNAADPAGVDLSGVGTVDTASLSISDVTMAEGNSGTTNATFTVTLTPASASTVTVMFATASGTATSGSDFSSTTGTLTFSPGNTTMPVSVPVIGDTKFENDETFFVNLSNPTNATISDPQGVGTITNDDARAARVFTSSSGSDENDCRNVGTPCRTFVESIFQVASGGEVIVLKTGSYGGATIDKSVKINVPKGVVAFTAASFTVAAGASDVVVLRGLTIKALTPGTGTGVTFNSGAALYVESCIFDGWDKGMEVFAAGQLFVGDTTVRNVASAGLRSAPNTGTALVTVERSRFEGVSGGCGVENVDGSMAVVRNSVGAGNVVGFCATGGTLDVQRSVAFDNEVAGIRSAGGTVRAAYCMVTNNGSGLENGGGIFQSLGNNFVQGNGTDTTGTITMVTGK